MSQQIAYRRPSAKTARRSARPITPSIRNHLQFYNILVTWETLQLRGKSVIWQWSPNCYTKTKAKRNNKIHADKISSENAFCQLLLPTCKHAYLQTHTHTRIHVSRIAQKYFCLAPQVLKKCDYCQLSPLTSISSWPYILTHCIYICMYILIFVRFLLLFS